ncbi:inositol monophosphatase [Paenibacillus sp. TRM 82003]|uniref:inositol monophosphatase family protein n=1 Tax=Kineococcus sp. TRM81007 TaxID=2925831 RepID=UPI001F568B99|nr:inositol monophosphatase family protein [Kineococcus sp. TRM81007]MCI2240396.1 inositol monophosphatase [Kineococcus sp. TRM81007]MCI3927428.1 inositol monophosphatase [Paenibacillus sp. TRM 82003]
MSGTAVDGLPGVPELAELRRVAVQAAAAAGELVRTGRPDRVEVAATKSTPTDVVTAMDHASEELLREVLGRLRPDDGVLGEEGGHRPGTSGLTWVVDPVDGTVNYLYGLRAYAVSVACVLDPSHGAERPDPATWTVLAGCVHDPTTGESWSAALGRGASLRDGEHERALPGPADVALERALVGTGFGYDPVRRAEQAAVLARLLPRVRDVRRVGSAALDLCWVGAGRLDAYYERGLKPWDLAAGALVAAEAGARVTGFDGGPAGPEGVLVAADGLHGALRAELAG